MKTITRAQFDGTTEQLQARVLAFEEALKAHAKTVGVPAPREEDFIEHLARTGEPFEMEREPVQPTAEELRAATVEQMRGAALFALRRAEFEAAALARRSQDDALLAAALADQAAPQEVKNYKAALDAPATEELRGR